MGIKKNHLFFCDWKIGMSTNQLRISLFAGYLRLAMLKMSFFHSYDSYVTNYHRVCFIRPGYRAPWHRSGHLHLWSEPWISTRESWRKSQPNWCWILMNSYFDHEKWRFLLDFSRVQFRFHHKKWIKVFMRLWLMYLMYLIMKRGGFCWCLTLI